MGGVIFVITLSVFHLFSNSYHPEKYIKCFFYEFLQEM